VEFRLRSAIDHHSPLKAMVLVALVEAAMIRQKHSVLSSNEGGFISFGHRI
jgi:hypothetical protein